MSCPEELSSVVRAGSIDACSGATQRPVVVRGGSATQRPIVDRGAGEMQRPIVDRGAGEMQRPIVVRGGGDLATGTIHRLCRAGYPVIILECGNPTAIRRAAAFSEAVRDGVKEVEGIVCTRAAGAEEALARVTPRQPMLLVDETCASLPVIEPEILVDAILAKKNLGTTMKMAPLTIALGPGFTAGIDVHYVIETMRGHNLGRIILEGSAIPNTGVPGIIGGYGKERVLHAPCDGILRNRAVIGDVVEKGQAIAYIEPLIVAAPSGSENSGATEAPSGSENSGTTEAPSCSENNGAVPAPSGLVCSSVPVEATLTGVLRGILPDGFIVRQGLKMADIDPRLDERNNCFTISDKSRCIAGSVLELVIAYEKHNLP